MHATAMHVFCSRQGQTGPCCQATQQLLPTHLFFNPRLTLSTTQVNSAMVIHLRLWASHLNRIDLVSLPRLQVLPGLGRQLAELLSSYLAHSSLDLLAPGVSTQQQVVWCPA